jgi:hypothetical protein
LAPRKVQHTKVAAPNDSNDSNDTERR